MAAARGMIRRLRDGDSVNVVAYNTTTTTLVAPTVIDERSREELMLALRNVEARGHTCISCGIDAGLAMLREREGAVNQMLLLSDGEANTGIRNVEGFRKLADQAREVDVSITSIGVDVDYNEQVMFALAQASNGRHYFVEDPGGLPKIFDEELQSLIKTVASDTQVEIELSPGVSVAELYDRTFTREGNTLLVPMGTFTQGDNKTVLMRVRLARADAGKRPVAVVRARYHDLVDDKASSCEGKLVAMATDDPGKVASLDPLVEARVGRAETLAALKQANEQFSAGRVEDARRTLSENQVQLRKRRTTSTKKAKKADVNRLDKDFERQIQALEEAEVGFDNAKQAAPAAPQRSRAGRSSVRRNMEDAALFGL